MTDDLDSGTDRVPHAAHDVHGDHRHGEDCGHEAAAHDDHRDYLHDGHRHAEHDGHYDEHADGDATTGPGGAAATAGLSSRT
jgi:hypothetical protein